MLLQYTGPREEMEDFFEYASAPTPTHYNPADHYISVVNTEFSLCLKSPDEWHTTFTEYRKKNDSGALLKSQMRHKAYEMKSQRTLFIENDEENQDDEAAASHRSTDGGDESYLDFLNFLKTPHNKENHRRPSTHRPSTIIHDQLSPEALRSFRTNGFFATIELIRRYMLNLVYNPGILFTRVAMYVMLALIIGALFWDLGDLTTFTSINSRIALLFYCVAFFVVRTFVCVCLH